jgi:cholesterol transport system auxiliary component
MIVAVEAEIFAAIAALRGSAAALLSSAARRMRLMMIFGLSCGCALTAKGEPLAPRYFSAEQPMPRTAEHAARGIELRLGQVRSAAHLDERMAFRVNSSEVGFHDDRRWTELPEAYLRRALERDLFETRELLRVVSGSAPTLDVELTAFEELRGVPSQARVSLRFTLRGERAALLEQSITLDRPLDARPGQDPAQRVAATLSSTLAEAVGIVADRVIARLTSASREAQVKAE